MKVGSKASLVAVVLFIWVFDAAVASGPGSEGPAAQAPSSPGILAGRVSITHKTDPLWVSSRDATTPEGNVNWDLLGPWAKTVFEGVAEQPPLPLSMADRMPTMSGVFYQTDSEGNTVTWLRYGPSSYDDPGGGPRTLERVAEISRGIYIGEVVAVETGFLLGDPGSLLTLRTEQIVKSSDEYDVENEFYLFWPKAKFQIGDLHFWKDNPDYPECPQVGTKMLVVADRRVALDVGHKLVLPEPETVFVEGAGDGVVLSPKLGSAASERFTSLSELAAELERLTATGEESVP